MIEFNKFQRLHHLLDHHVRERPDVTGLVAEDSGPITYRVWQQKVEDLVQWCREMGVTPGQRIMAVAENSALLTALALAASRLDAWYMPVNARLSGGEIDRLAEHARPALIVYTSGVSSPAKAHAARRNAKPGPDFDYWTDDTAQPEPVYDEPDRQVAALMYTTGTTGDPKGVMLSHTSLLWYANITREFRRLTDKDFTYCALPITHIYGFASALLGNLCAGSVLELATRFEPARVFQAIQDGATVLPAVPAMYAHLLDYAEAQNWDAPPPNQLRYLMTGGAPLDPDWKRRVESFFHLPLHNGYGMTECAPGISSSKNLTYDVATAEDVSCGHPLPGLDVQVVPAPGQNQLVEGVGEVIVKGPNIMLGYYKNTKATSEVMDENGYFHTGDLGHFSEDGRLYLDGRSKELIIRSGFNVYPPEVEASLTKHPSVTLAAVVGRSVPGNEEVLAFVQNVPGTEVTEQELKDFLRTDLAPYKMPARIVVSQSLPASSTGKLLKSKMLETFADQI